MEYVALAAAAVQAGSAIIGYLIQNGKENEAYAILEKARQQYGNVSPPVLEKIAYQTLGPTAYSRIKLDPTYKNAQLAALTKMQEEANGGMTVADRATEQAALGTAARQQQAGFNQILDSANARGIGGSGSELAMLMANQQQGADRSNTAAMSSAAQAQMRAYQALRDSSNLAGSMRGQDYSEQARAAQAQDAINQYNNDLINKQTYFNSYTLPMQNYENQRQHAQDQYQMAKDEAAIKTGQGQNAANTAAGVGAGLSQAAVGYGMYANRNPGVVGPTASRKPDTQVSDVYGPIDWGDTQPSIASQQDQIPGVQPDDEFRRRFSKLQS